MSEKPRPEPDRLHLKVAPVSAASGGGFQVLVYVNGAEMTAAGAGLGMDPFDVLIPDNRLIASTKPRTVPIARCECGEYGCGSTDVTIKRDDDLVHWEWSIVVPMNRNACFATDGYDSEVARVAADYSWETPSRTAGRLVLTNLDRESLRSSGLRPSWAGDDYRDPGRFQVALELGGDYQIFLAFPWRGQRPAELAAEVCQTLERRPGEWEATWHSVRPAVDEPPVIAGPSWRKHC